MHLHLVLHPCQVYHYVTEDTQTAAILHWGQLTCLGLVVVQR